MSAADVPALTWTHTDSGRWVTEADVNGEAGVFTAVAMLNPGVGYVVNVYTHGRPLDSAEVDYLADAREVAQQAYDAVEGPNR